MMDRPMRERMARLALTPEDLFFLVWDNPELYWDYLYDYHTMRGLETNDTATKEYHLNKAELIRVGIQWRKGER